MLGNDPGSSQERREFFRLNYAAPLHFKAYQITASRTSTASVGRSRNVSQSGVLFQTEKNPPQLASIVWMNLDLRTLTICKEIERRALIFNNGLLGRVVRVEEDPGNNSIYDIGVCFLTQGQQDSKEVQQVISQISQTTS